MIIIRCMLKIKYMAVDGVCQQQQQQQLSICIDIVVAVAYK